MCFTAEVQVTAAELSITVQDDARVVPGGTWSMKCGASDLKNDEKLQVIKVSMECYPTIIIM